MRIPLIVIVGPTASGKSALAVHLAKKFNGEIISADSRQIYRGLDIGTGKVPGKWLTWKPLTWKPRFQALGNGVSKYVYKEIRHHCIDFVPPKKTCTAAEYKKCAEQAIRDISGRRKIPILVGGTGFWIDAVVYDLGLPAVAPNQKLRRSLEQKNTDALFKILQKLDPERAKTIEQKNPRRLVRAIEIAKALDRVPKLKKYPRYQTLWLGLNPPKDILKRRIAHRVKDMLRAGLIKETGGLWQSRLGEKRIREFGFEYRLSLDYLENKISRQQLHQQLVGDTLNYARRQMRWFGRNPEIRWIRNNRSSERLVRLFMNKTKDQKPKNENIK